MVFANRNQSVLARCICQPFTADGSEEEDAQDGSRACIDSFKNYWKYKIQIDSFTLLLLPAPFLCSILQLRTASSPHITVAIATSSTIPLILSDARLFFARGEGDRDLPPRRRGSQSDQKNLWPTWMMGTVRILRFVILGKVPSFAKSSWQENSSLLRVDKATAIRRPSSESMVSLLTTDMIRAPRQEKLKEIAGKSTRASSDHCHFLLLFMRTNPIWTISCKVHLNFEKGARTSK